MKTKQQWDFSGYATKNNIKCTDGRVIQQDAFKDNDGQTVPLVWHHLHNDPANILGHALLENRPDGVYAYCSFNAGKAGQDAKLAVEHKDIKSLSIYANGLEEKGKNVVHGIIREVSLVMAGANPGAVIENLAIQHEDGSDDTILDDEAVIKFVGLEEFEFAHEETEKKTAKVVEHADDANTKDAANPDKTVGDVWKTLNPEQLTAVYAVIGEMLDAASEEDNSVAQSDNEGDKKGTMKHNVFDGDDNKEMNNQPGAVLTHAQFDAIVEDAKKCGSFKTAFLAHVQSYGIENIDYLFPDAKTVTNEPVFVKRDTGWVSSVLPAAKHTPFSRIKTLFADITADEARAKGYVKASLKTEEVFRLLRRTTDPTTVYKKQKLDRDDIVDITDINVVVWLKGEMRLMLDEELARAVLVGDGRDPASPDKIDETHIRPIWKDDDFYAHKVRVDADTDASELIDAIVRSRTYYKGSGSPVFFTTSSVLSDMLLLKDTLGRRIYANRAELEAALLVSKIVEVPVMDGLTHDVEEVSYGLKGIIVNLQDYTLGADKGGEVNMFDDFDIDYNQYKYLIETRCSGALTLPKSALVIEQAVAGQ